MPKKLKLDLNKIKVQSFITELSDDEKKLFKGGDGAYDSPDNNPWTNTCGTGCNCTGSLCSNCGGPPCN